MTDSFIQLPPDSSGKQLNTDEQLVGVNTVHTQRMQIAGGGVVTNIANVDRLGALNVKFSEGTPGLDAFGRLMVTQMQAIYLEHFVDEFNTAKLTATTVGGGAVARVAQSSSLRLSVGTASGDIARVESNGIVKYSPGIGMTASFTAWSGDAGKLNVRRRAGLFDDENGVFFELDGTTMSFVVRSSATGSTVDTKFAQNTWDDPLDGTGLSGMTVDFTNLNIFWFDYQWLGGGAVRYGVYDPLGNRITAGVVQNANTNPRPFMQTGSNRFRTEIENTGASGSSSEISLVCISVRSDGEASKGREVFGDISQTGLGVAGSDVYLGAVRPKALYRGVTNKTVAIPIVLEVYTDQPVKVDLYLGGTVTGGTYAVSSDGSLEHDIAGSAYAGGRILRSSLADVGVTVFDLTRFADESLKAVNLWPGGLQPEFGFVASQLDGSAATALSYTVRYEELL